MRGVVIIYGWDVFIVGWLYIWYMYLFDMNFLCEKYDFDRVVWFMDLMLCESIDFTGVLNDFWTGILIVY